jgi:hypothetical protein
MADFGGLDDPEIDAELAKPPGKPELPKRKPGRPRKDEQLGRIPGPPRAR